jgi:hypothetical protein
MLPDIFNNDAFSMVQLTAAINEIDHVPGRAGELVFTAPDVSKGVETLSIAIERVGETISLISTSMRGGPAEKEKAPSKRDLIGFDIPQIKLEDTVYASSVQEAREFGSNQDRTVESVVNSVMKKLVQRHDLTLEHHRLGAIKGVITDADGSVLTDLFAAFGILNSSGFAAPEEFNFNLDSDGVGFTDALRIKCQNVTRTITRLARMPIPKEAQVWAFCGDEFFDKLISHPSVKEVWDGFGSAESILKKGGNFAFGIFEFGGIFFENYRGTDDNETVAVAPDECRFFLNGVPGLWAEYFAPASFMETVNTPGLPRYARLALDKRFQQFVELHTQQNPLPLCLRPRTLMKGIAN